MGLLEIIKGEQPGIIRSLLNFEDKGQFGEYYIDFALSNHNLDGNFSVFRNVYVPCGNKTSEVDLIMVHEKGIFVFESKNYSGWIFGSEDQLQWTQSLNGGQKNRFYNPLRQNQTHINALSQYLEIPSEAFYSYIVFSERCELKQVPPSTASRIIVRRPKMLHYLRETLKNNPIVYTPEDMQTICTKLSSLTNVSESEKQQHIEDINTKCPYCGNELVLRKGKYGEFWGCSSYPKCKFTKNVE